jgi:adenylate cyclase
MERRLTAILAADVVGYSRLMGNNEVGTLAALKAHRTELVDKKIAEHRGRIVKLMGDGMLVEFPSVVNAVACAADIQRGMRERNTGVPEDQRIEFRIGIHLDDVIVEENDIYGDGVNVASRIEGVANPGGIAVSAAVRDNVGNRLDIAFDDAGEHQLKNIDRLVRIYNIELGTPRGTLDALPDGVRRSGQLVKPSIAVLPFNNMSGDREQEYFSDGITEDIITDLSKISGLRVIARNSVFNYKGKPIDVEEICRRFKVSAVLEGSVRKAGQRVRITTQLVNGRDSGHLWAERYDRDLTDIFAIQDDIAHAIVAQLKVRLLPEEKESLEATPTDNVEAYNHYLKGRQFSLAWTKSNLLRARWMFAKAAQLDPNYARAYAGIAACDSILYLNHFAEASLEGILATTAKALALEPKLAEAHASRGLALLHFGRSEEAVEAFERALEIDPNLYEANFFYARYFYARGDFKKVAELLERAAQIRADDYRSPALLVAAYRSLGREGDRLRCARLAVERAERGLAEHPEDSSPAQFGAIALTSLGERDRAREWAHRAISMEPDDIEAQYIVASAYAQIGDLDQAMDLLEKAHRLPNLVELLSWTKNDPDLDPLRNHPRYRAMIASLDKL